jgi:hypothetical protein
MTASERHAGVYFQMIDDHAGGGELHHRAGRVRKILFTAPPWLSPRMPLEIRVDGRQELGYQRLPRVDLINRPHLPISDNRNAHIRSRWDRHSRKHCGDWSIG